MRYWKIDATEYFESQENCSEFTQRSDTGTSPVSNRRGLWKRPPYGWTKCNFDGSFHK